MDEMYELHSTTAQEYADEALMSPENLMLPPDYNSAIMPSEDLQHRIPVFGSEELGFQCSAVSESASINVEYQREGDEEERAAVSTVIKAKISSHPSYPKLLDAYIDCQKVGAPPEIANLLDEIRREKDLCKQDAVSICPGVDPELDQFMETYCGILVKYKSDLSRPFDEATSFLNKIEARLRNLCNDKSL